jgi:hypothetical protein
MPTVREEDLTGARQSDLIWLRLLDLEDELSFLEDCADIGHDARALARVVGIRDRGALARSRLDHDVMPAADQLARAGRGQRDAVYGRPR